MLRLLIVLACVQCGHALFRLPLHEAPSIREFRAKREAGNYPITVNWGNMVYSVNIEIGTPPQKFSVVPDTGSWELVVAGTGCSGCHAQNTYNSDASSTWENLYEFTNRSYKIGSYKGTYGTDIVCLGSDRTFCTNTTQQFVFIRQAESMIGDGIMGLDKDVEKPNALDHFYSHPSCTEKVFAFYYTTWSPDSDHLSEMTICGTDPSHYKGEIQWLSALYPYALNLTQFRVGDAVIDQRKNDHEFAYFDSGASFATISNDAMEKLIGDTGARNFNDSPYYNVKCEDRDKLPTITFQFNGIDFPMNGKDYTLEYPQPPLKEANGYCAFALFVDDRFKIGATFMRKYYTVYDRDNVRIGIAEAI